MYNKQNKVNFLESIIENTSVFNRTAMIFKKAESWETEKNKDICEFSKEEVMEFYIMLYYSTLKSLQQINYSLKRYSSWAIEEKMVSENIFIKINNEDLLNCISNFNGDSKKKTISYEKLKGIIIKQNNYYNKFILIALFCGLKGNQLEELTLAEPKHLHPENLTMDVYRYSDSLIPYLHRTIEVPKELIDYGIKAADTYEKYDSTGRLNSFLIGNRIIKEAKDSNRLIDNHNIDEVSKDIIKRYYSVSNKFKIINSTTDFSLTPQIVHISGMAYNIREKALELDISPLDLFVKDREFIYKLMNRYGYKTNDTKKYILLNNFKILLRKYLE